MADRIDLSDPSFEPSDEQLIGLATRAFAGVKEANERSLERLRLEIAREREKALQRLREPSQRSQAP